MDTKGQTMDDPVNSGNADSLRMLLDELDEPQTKLLNDQLAEHADLRSNPEELAEDLARLNDEELARFTEDMAQMQYERNRDGDGKIAQLASILMVMGVEEQDRRTRDEID